jgi:hypothetical protein
MGWAYRYLIIAAKDRSVYMSLLREIQDGATEDSVSLGSLLRKTKLLAAPIGVKEIGGTAIGHGG